MGESYVLLGGAFNNCEDKECGLGNLVTDAMLWRVMENQGSRGWSDVGIVLMNSGGIRSSLNRGKSIPSMPALKASCIKSIDVRPIRKTP